MRNFSLASPYSQHKKAIITLVKQFDVSFPPSYISHSYPLREVNSRSSGAAPAAIGAARHEVTRNNFALISSGQVELQHLGSILVGLPDLSACVP